MPQALVPQAPFNYIMGRDGGQRSARWTSFRRIS
jgi:hypothetical protein